MRNERICLYDEVYDFLLNLLPYQQIMDFRLSEVGEQRLSELLQANRDRGLTADEETELNEYMRAEHLMIMLKAKAYERLKQSS